MFYISAVKYEYKPHGTGHADLQNGRSSLISNDFFVRVYGSKPNEMVAKNKLAVTHRD